MAYKRVFPVTVCLSLCVKTIAEMEIPIQMSMGDKNASEKKLYNQMVDCKLQNEEKSRKIVMIRYIHSETRD